MIRRKKKRQVDLGAHRERQAEAGREAAQERPDVHLGDDPRQGVQEHVQVVALIEQDPVPALRDQGSAGNTVVVIGLAAAEAASGVQEAVRVHLLAALGQRADSVWVLNGLRPKWLYRPI